MTYKNFLASVLMAVLLALPFVLYFGGMTQ